MFRGHSLGLRLSFQDKHSQTLTLYLLILSEPQCVSPAWPDSKRPLPAEGGLSLSLQVLGNHQVQTHDLFLIRHGWQGYNRVPAAPVEIFPALESQQREIIG